MYSCHFSWHPARIPSGRLGDDPKAIARLRQALLTAGYTVDGIRGVLGASPDLSFSSTDVQIYARRLAGDGSLPVLIRLFLLGLEVSAETLAAAVAPLAVDELSALGMIEAAESGVRATLRLAPNENLFIASDWPPELQQQPARSDQVLGINPSTALLARLTVRLPSRLTLDLGTGCGIQALLAAAHSDHVIGTDINPRALDFSRFNAELNGIRNVEWLEGSSFEPVQGRAFDLIVSNPPYVISPDTKYLYRDSGLPADTLCRRWVEQMPEHLAERGIAQTLVCWVSTPSESWSAPLSRWVEGRGCDAWLLHHETDDPLTYAAKWNLPVRAWNFARLGRSVDDWLDYYRSSGIQAISFGAIVLRRRTDGPNWTRMDELPAGAGPAGDHILRVIESQDRLQQLGEPRRLLDTRLKLVEGAVLEQAMECRSGRWEVQQAILRMSQGLAFRGSADAPTVFLVPLLDGQRTLRTALEECGRRAAVEPAELDAFVEMGVQVAWRLIELGFLALP